MIWVIKDFDLFRLADKISYKITISFFLISWFITHQFFGVTVLVILIGTFSGILLKKILPKGFILLNGGR